MPQRFIGMSAYDRCRLENIGYSAEDEAASALFSSGRSPQCVKETSDCCVKVRLAMDVGLQA
jgi:hypothetical protein